MVDCVRIYSIWLARGAWFKSRENNFCLERNMMISCINYQWSSYLDVEMCHTYIIYLTFVYTTIIRLYYDLRQTQAARCHGKLHYVIASWVFGDGYCSISWSYCTNLFINSIWCRYLLKYYLCFLDDLSFYTDLTRDASNLNILDIYPV